MYLVKNYKKTFIFFLGYFSLLIGFYLNENSSGGALPDFNHHYKVLLEFELNFFESILNYSKFNTDHSPVFIIILQAINLFFQDINFTRIAYLTIFSSTTIIFYNCLVLKYKNVNQDVLFFFSSILFISPNFRSLLIWPGSEIASLFFFLISIKYFFIFEKKKKFSYVLLNILFLGISAYIRPIFALFSIFFFIKYFYHFKFSKKLIYIILINFLLSAPAVFYIFFVNNFVMSSLSTHGSWNFSNKIILISSILFFHFIPFLHLLKKKLFINYKSLVFFIINIFFIILLINSFNFNFENHYYGGGFFFKISNIFFSNNYILYFSSFIFLFITSCLLKNSDKLNIIIYLILFTMIPHSYYYHEYYEPLFLILLFSIIKFNFIDNYFLKNSNLYIIFIFYLSFYTISLIKNLNILNTYLKVQ